MGKGLNTEEEKALTVAVKAFFLSQANLLVFDEGGDAGGGVVGEKMGGEGSFQLCLDEAADLPCATATAQGSFGQTLGQFGGHLQGELLLLCSLAQSGELLPGDLG